MNAVSGNTAGILHAQPVWAVTRDGTTGEPVRMVVDRLMAERIDDACWDRVLRRAAHPTPMRYRVGHAISGLGERIAGERPARPVA